MNERNVGYSIVVLKNNIAQHIDYIINVSVKIGLIKSSEKELKRLELWALPIEKIYKISEQAEEVCKIHKDVITLDRFLSEIKEHGKEFVLKKYLGKREVPNE